MSLFFSRQGIMRDLNYYFFSAKVIKQSIRRAKLPDIEYADIIDGVAIRFPDYIDSKRSPPAAMPQSLLEIVLFSVIDSIVDSKYPDLIDECFSKKYKLLPSSTKLETVFKETYRVMKLLRNASVHNEKSVSRDGSEFMIDYINGKTLYKINCSQSAVGEIYSLCLLFIENFGVDDEYFSLIASTCFNRFVSGLKCYCDDGGDYINFVECDERFYFYKRYRYRVPFESLSIVNGFFVIDRMNGTYRIFIENKEYKKEDCDEYLIEGDSGEVHLIPGHKLDNEGRISMAEFAKWKVNPQKYFGKNEQPF
jgi:hypothetical protein